MLSNVLDPSALIGKDYLAHVIATTDGRVLTGIIRAEDKDTITLVTANETIILPKSEVEERRAERAVDDARRPLDAALRARNPLAWSPISPARRRCRCRRRKAAGKLRDAGIAASRIARASRGRLLYGSWSSFRGTVRS